MILYGLNSSKFIKVTHTGKFNEENKASESGRKRVVHNINVINTISSDDYRMKELNRFLTDYKEKMVIDETNHGTVNTGKKSVKTNRVLKNIGFLNSLNK
jgi:ribosomal protein S18